MNRGVMPTLIIDWVEVEGPITTEATRKKRSGILPNNEEDIEEISECLQRFAERALRRPVVDSEIERYVEFINHEKGQVLIFNQLINQLCLVY